MSVTAIEIDNREGLPIRGDLHLPDGESPHRLVLIAHGFKGFKDWGFFPFLLDEHPIKDEKHDTESNCGINGRNEPSDPIDVSEIHRRT